MRRILRDIVMLLALGELSTTLALIAVVSMHILITGEDVGRDLGLFIAFAYCVSTMVGIPSQTYVLWASEELHKEDRSPLPRPPSALM